VVWKRKEREERDKGDEREEGRMYEYGQ